jgi:hypothetical protein
VRCARHRTALGQVWVRRDEAWLGRVGTCNAVSYWRRLAGLTHEPSGSGGAGEWLSGALPEVLAAQLALSCFGHLTGMAPALAQPELARVDLRTLDARRHLVHPSCGLPVLMSHCPTLLRVSRLQPRSCWSAWPRTRTRVPVSSGCWTSRI